MIQRNPELMWSPGIAHWFGIQKSDFVRENVTLHDFIHMIDFTKTDA